MSGLRVSLLAMFSLIWATAFSSRAAAMNVSPMAVELTTTGSKSSARIQVLNVNPQALPFEVKVYRLDFGPDGKSVETPADGDFIVFPPQGLIKTNQRQVVRIQWIGGALDSSRGYHVAINQLPVPLDPTKINKTKRAFDVQVVYHMKVLATVAPPGSKPIVFVENVHPIMIAQRPALGMKQANSVPVPGIAVTVRNTGKRYAMLAGVKWLIQGKSLDNKPLKILLSVQQVGEILGAGYVPALDGRRTFEVPTGVRFANAPITVKFSD